MTPSKQQRFPNSYEPYCVLKTTDGNDTLLNLPDYIKASKLSWHTDVYGRIYHKKLNNQTLFLSRYILNPHADEVIDHANRDVKDNRRYNLRVTTQKNNSRNLGLNKNNTSGYKGVSQHKNRYRAYICVDRRQINLGSFKNPEAAALAYNKAATKYFGEFARLNNVKS